MSGIRLSSDDEESDLHISSDSNWALFEKIADFLESQLNGSWAKKVDGFDQRYWDLKIEDKIITLHLEHYLGISVSSDSKDLLFRAKQAIESSAL